VVARVAVLVSGAGTNLQALIDARSDAHDIVGVISDRVDAVGLVRARDAGIPGEVVDPAQFPDRAAWDVALAECLSAMRPDWVVCAGFMRILGASVLEAFPARIINTHPALLPSFPGAHGVRDALAYGVRVSGCTVHLVDSGVDTGPILAQRAVDIADGDDEASLHERIKVVERDLLVDIVSRLCTHGCTVVGRKVSIP
jgi:phosphoribosylglycinamide formyltransferase 1